MKETEMRRARRNESAPPRTLNDAELECVNTESATASKLNIQKHQASNIDPTHVGHAFSNLYAIKTEQRRDGQPSWPPDRLLGGSPCWWVLVWPINASPSAHTRLENVLVIDVIRGMEPAQRPV